MGTVHLSAFKESALLYHLELLFILHNFKCLYGLDILSLPLFASDRRSVGTLLKNCRVRTRIPHRPDIKPNPSPFLILPPLLKIVFIQIIQSTARDIILSCQRYKNLKTRTLNRSAPKPQATLPPIITPLPTYSTWKSPLHDRSSLSTIISV